MSDDLLKHYNSELTFIRLMGERFALDNPKIAERLRLRADDASDDPHVERLIEAFAYLTARVRNKLEDELPEITEALLHVLYPHYLAPIPSMSIVQFKVDPNEVQLPTGYAIARHTELETDPSERESCRFRTCYPVTLWPVEVQSAFMAQAPLPAPVTQFSEDAVAVVRIGLRCTANEASFATLGLRTLRFFLKGQPYVVHRLYELLFNNTVGLVVSRPDGRGELLTLAPDALSPVGFARDEGLLPYPARSFLGYRLLTEYFALPQKFMFLDLNLDGIESIPQVGNTIVVYIYLNRVVPELARPISAETFQLGCTPVVNLFTQPAEPIRLTHTHFEYQVVPDRRRPESHEVYSVDKVMASPPQGDSLEFHPFFSTRHATKREKQTAFWLTTRRPAEVTAERKDHGTELYLSLVDLGFRPSAPANWVLEVQTTCLNRDLPAKLPFGGDQPRFQLREQGGVVTRVVCLTPPTRALRPNLREGLLWKLISHLSLNHISLVANSDGEALREILKLYDFTDSDETRNQIDGIVGVSSQRVVGSIRTSGPLTFCRGAEVSIQFDEDRYTGSGLFLFASVLERFLALYCTVNSFTKLIATIKGRDGVLRRWPPRMGENVMV
jgi:type VI secretion system protein ImpG